MASCRRRLLRYGGPGRPEGPARERRAATVSDELDRAYEFLARGDMRGERTEPSRFGVAVFDDRLPLRYDSNYLLVDRLPATVAAGELAGEAARLERPSILVRDRQTGERLAPAEIGRAHV